MNTPIHTDADPDALACSPGMPHCSEDLNAITRYFCTSLHGGSNTRSWMAQIIPPKYFFFIADEINRDNMSKNFGDLLMAIDWVLKGFFGLQWPLVFRTEEPLYHRHDEHCRSQSCHD